MKKVLILGSNGFLGRHLANSLTRIPELQVEGFGLPSVNLSTVSKYHSGNFETGEGLEAALADQNIVYHLISQTIPVSSWSAPLDEIDKNLRPTIRLIESAAEHRIERICYASSGGTVYGLECDVATETSPTAPFSPYGITKRAIESLLEYGRHRFEMSYEIYRISNLYGEGQDVSKGLGFINTALSKAISGEPITIFGDGTVVRDYIYAPDAAKLIAESVLIDGPSETFNLSSNRSVDLNEVIEIIRNVTHLNLEVRYEPTRANDNRSVRIDNSRILQRTGKMHLTSLEEGIKRTFEFMKAKSMHAKESI